MMTRTAESVSTDSFKPMMVIAVGASAGGLREIRLLVEQLPRGFQGIMIIANHRSPGQGNALAEMVSRWTCVEVHPPEDEEVLECTTVYVGTSDETVELNSDGFQVVTDISRQARFHRIDDLFKSVARSAGRNAVGIILSGMLSDGVAGLQAIQQAGGYCIVQAPEDAQFDSMPVHAIERITPDFIGTTPEIASRLMELAISRGSCESL